MHFEIAKKTHRAGNIVPVRRASLRNAGVSLNLGHSFHRNANARGGTVKFNLRYIASRRRAGRGKPKQAGLLLENYILVTSKCQAGGARPESGFILFQNIVKAPPPPRETNLKF